MRGSTQCEGARRRPNRRRQRSSDRQPLVGAGIALTPELRVNVDKPVAPVLNRAIPAAGAAPRGAAVDDDINYRFIGDFIMKIPSSIQHRVASRSMSLVVLL